MASNPSANGNPADMRSVAPMPDFCDIQVQFRVVLTAELVALVIALVRASPDGLWLDFTYVSMFSLTLVLAWSMFMCRLMRLRKQWSVPLLYGIGYVAGLVLASGCAVLGWYISNRFSVFTGSESLAEFLFRVLLVVAAASGLAMRYLYIEYEARRELYGQAQARIDALQARIRPHFLFNTLNTIAELIRSDPPGAENAIEDLADLYRANLANGARFVTLEEELHICHQYLGIEQYRLGDRLRVQWETDSLPMRSKLPCLTLQPLVENAIYHGIEPLQDGGEILISGALEGSVASIRITNPVGGEAIRSSGYQVAWENTRQRLKLAFPKSGKLTSGKLGDYYWVQVEFDVETEAATGSSSGGMK